jgi:hypothetical protein
MRRSLLPLLLGAVLVTGCGPASVLFTFDNQTDETLCDLHVTPAESDEGSENDCLASIQPQGTTKWGRDCDNENDRPIRMVIDRDRSVIYDRTATCGEGNHHGRITIRTDGDAFVVTDELKP